MNVGILDYGAGNLRSVCRAIEYLGYNYHLVSDKKDFASIEKLVIPGVGAFKVAMDQLLELDLIDAIKKIANEGVPILGICLGMQMLFDESTERGYTKGLGLIKGNVDVIPSMGLHGGKLKVPHIGWNELLVDNRDCSLVSDIQKDDAVYFVHSYRVEGYDEKDLVAHCVYDGLILPAIVQHKNVLGCQFHPEKSGNIGLNIFDKFVMDIK